MRPKIYLTVSVDSECDKGTGWEIKKPLSFTNISEGIPLRLQPLFEEFCIKPTYLLSPEIMVNDKAAGVFQALGEKVELGTHLHSEFIEPKANWETNKTLAFQADLSPQVEYQKLSNLTELFQKKFNYYPKSFRAGRFGLSGHTLRFLEKLGYLVDSSVTPFTWWGQKRGRGVNFLGAPNQPYFPSARDFRKPGKMRILEVPISIINPFWQSFPFCLLRSIRPLNRFQAVVFNIFIRKKLQSVWLRPTYSSVNQMMLVTDWIVKKARKKKAVLNMMFHSNEITPGTSPYNQTESDVGRFFEKLRRYFASLFLKFDVQPIFLREVVRTI